MPASTRTHPTPASDSDQPGVAPHASLRHVPYMGVIFVVAEAMKRGFSNGHPDWCNLGQGQPEVGPMAGAPERIREVSLDPGDAAYGPLEGTPELRGAVAAYANRLFRVGRESQYTAANVAIAGGGRLALTRAMAALGEITLGYQLPDYTAYEDMLGAHLQRLTAIPLRGESPSLQVDARQLAAEVVEKGLGAYLFSNPTNPTGAVLAEQELAALAQLAREKQVTLLSDEFYSHFTYRQVGQLWQPAAGPTSLAAHVADVNEDPILIFDGLTKNHRYPGWRIGWVLGPPQMVETMARTASSIDGGPSRVAQRAAMQALEPVRADQETQALRQVFCDKRNLMVERLRAMGVRFDAEPAGTFYCWGSLEDLPAPFDDAMSFFWRALDRRVMTVPGQFFDVNPGKRRKASSPYSRMMRFSFGPPRDNVELGLERLEAMLREGC